MEQMRSDPKHFEAQLILSCAAVEKKPNTQNINALANNLSALVANGIVHSDLEEANISANMLAQNLLQLNQNSSIDDSSLSPQTGSCTNGGEQKVAHVSDFHIDDTKTNSCKFYSKVSEDTI